MQFFPKNLSRKIVSFIFSAILLHSVNLYAEPIHHSDKFLREETIKNIEEDDLRGEDLRIRRAAIEALGERAGTIVVMSPNTGRIYSIVNQKWAIEKGFKPCSTIKLVTGIAGYNERLITSNGNLSNESFRLNLDDSLAYSNNAYFQRVGDNLGSGKLIRYARQLGLGKKTGINAENESDGQLPFGNENLRIYSHADDFKTTPLQLGVMVSAITNGGNLVIPKIPRSRYEKTNFRGHLRSKLNLRSNVYERVIPGMMGAVKYGTARAIRNTNLDIAGKTGSCISEKTWVGLFASVAPIQNPKFAVVVITKGSKARGKYSAAIAEKIYRTLQPRFNRTFEGTLIRKTVVVKPNSKTMSENSVRKNKSKRQNSVKKKKPKTNQRTSNSKPAETTEKKVRKKKNQKKENLFPTVVIKGKSEITRPRIVRNQ